MVVIRVVGLAALCATFAGVALSCAAGSTQNQGGSGNTSTGTGTGSGGATVSAMGGSTTGATGSGGDSFFDAGHGDAEIDPDAACGLITKEAKSTPLDLYIAFDKSNSMGSGPGSKWEAAKGGLSAFVNDKASDGIKVALNFFPLDGNPTCDQHAYEAPVVPFGVLPGNATPIVDAMNATTANGFTTPIYPALGGAILAAKAQANANPGDSAAVLLVTDGKPQGPSTSCAGVSPEDPAAIASLATAGVGYGVKTFVVGLPGVDQTIANQIALAGGTGTAIVVGTVDVAGDFQKALAKVRGEALPCTYEVPSEVSGGQVDFGHVNVLVSVNGGAAAVLPQNPSCSGAGWKYDDPSNPKNIVFCAQSCTAIKADLTAKAQIMLGCATVVY